MDAGPPISSTESAPATRMTSRRHPLHTCGVSLIALAHIVISKSQDFDGLIGSIMKKMAALARLVSPFVFAVLYLWLAVLSFYDNFIVAAENVIEILFPSSALLFNKIDVVIEIVEVLPRKLDDAMNKFPIIIHQTPLQDYVLVHVISWLKFVLASLTSENMNEKEIMIDINYQQLNTEFASVDDSHGYAESPSHFKSETLEKFPPVSDTIRAETDTDGSFLPVSDTQQAETETGRSIAKLDSFVEVIDKGTQRKVQNKEDDAEKGTEGKFESKEDYAEKGTEGKVESKEDDAEKGTQEKVECKEDDAGKGTQGKVESKEADAGKGKQGKVESKEADAGKGAQAKVESKEDDAGKGTQEKVESEHADAMEEEIIESKEDVAMEKLAEGEEVKDASKSDAMDDQILMLFESGWHLTPPKRR